MSVSAKHKKTVTDYQALPEAWIVDPKRKTFEIYTNSKDGFILSFQAKNTGKVKSQILDVEIDLKDIFEEE